MKRKEIIIEEDKVATEVEEEGIITTITMKIEIMVEEEEVINNLEEVKEDLEKKIRMRRNLKLKRNLIKEQWKLILTSRGLTGLILLFETINLKTREIFSKKFSFKLILKKN